MRNRLLYQLSLCSVLCVANGNCGPVSQSTKNDLNSIAAVVDNPINCTFVSAFDSDPSAAIVCKGVEGVVSAVLTGIASMKKASPPAKNYHSIVLPGDSTATVYLRSDLWTADVEAKIVAGIKAQRVPK